MPEASDLDLGDDDLGVEVGVNEEHTCFTVVIFAKRSIPLESVSETLREIAEGILTGDHVVNNFEAVDSH